MGDILRKQLLIFSVAAAMAFILPAALMAGNTKDAQLKRAILKVENLSVNPNPPKVKLTAFLQ